MENGGESDSHDQPYSDGDVSVMLLFLFLFLPMSWLVYLSFLNCSDFVVVLFNLHFVGKGDIPVTRRSNNDDNNRDVSPTAVQVAVEGSPRSSSSSVTAAGGSPRRRDKTVVSVGETVVVATHTVTPQSPTSDVRVSSRSLQVTARDPLMVTRTDAPEPVGSDRAVLQRHGDDGLYNNNSDDNNESPRDIRIEEDLSDGGAVNVDYDEEGEGRSGHAPYSQQSSSQSSSPRHQQQQQQQRPESKTPIPYATPNNFLRSASASPQTVRSTTSSPKPVKGASTRAATVSSPTMSSSK